MAHCHTGSASITAWSPTTNVCFAVGATTVNTCICVCVGGVLCMMSSCSAQRVGTYMQVIIGAKKVLCGPLEGVHCGCRVGSVLTDMLKEGRLKKSVVRSRDRRDHRPEDSLLSTAMHTVRGACFGMTASNNYEMICCCLQPHCCCFLQCKHSPAQSYHTHTHTHKQTLNNSSFQPSHHLKPSLMQSLKQPQVSCCWGS